MLTLIEGQHSDFCSSLASASQCYELLDPKKTINTHLGLEIPVV